MRRIAPERLRQLRNDVDIAIVAERLAVVQRGRARRRRFLCPECQGSATTLNSRSNLAYCFRCVKSFNPIDLVIAVRRCAFLEALRFLDALPRRS